MAIKHTVQGASALVAELTKSSRHQNHKDTITVKDGQIGRMKITFQRTIRVPDNSETSFLPPTFGEFPLFSAATYQNTLPKDMADKGGVFLPMYQREAMWINFSAHRPFAVKVLLGGVNAISGEPPDESYATAMRRLRLVANGKSIQDYLAVPDQLWLDGIAVQEGKVRQFVAVRLGSQYSVEAQVTGKEVNGGLQFIIVPSHLPEPANTISSSHNRGPTSLRVKTLTGKTFTLHDLDPAMTVENLKYLIEDEEDIPIDQQVLIYDRWQLENGKPLNKYHIPHEGTIHLILRLRGGGSLRDTMSIAPGGLIKQCIVPDPYLPCIWDLERAVTFNLQILNSEIFRAVTGFAPPASPVSAKDYVNHGLPYYDIYEEKSNIKGDFAGIKSVHEMDVDKSIATGKRAVEEEHSVDNPVIALNAQGDVLSFKPMKVMMEELQGMNYAQF